MAWIWIVSSPPSSSPMPHLTSLYPPSPSLLFSSFHSSSLLSFHFLSSLSHFLLCPVPLSSPLSSPSMWHLQPAHFFWLPLHPCTLCTSSSPHPSHSLSPPPPRSPRSLTPSLWPPDPQWSNQNHGWLDVGTRCDYQAQTAVSLSSPFCLSSYSLSHLLCLSFFLSFFPSFLCLTHSFSFTQLIHPSPPGSLCCVLSPPSPPPVSAALASPSQTYSTSLLLPTPFGDLNQNTLAHSITHALSCVGKTCLLFWTWTRLHAVGMKWWVINATCLPPHICVHGTEGLGSDLGGGLRRLCHSSGC